MFYGPLAHHDFFDVLWINIQAFLMIHFFLTSYSGPLYDQKWSVTTRDCDAPATAAARKINNHEQIDALSSKCQ